MWHPVDAIIGNQEQECKQEEFKIESAMTSTRSSKIQSAQQPIVGSMTLNPIGYISKTSNPIGYISKTSNLIGYISKTSNRSSGDSSMMWHWQRTPIGDDVDWWQGTPPQWGSWHRPHWCHLVWWCGDCWQELPLNERWCADCWHRNPIWSCWHRPHRCHSNGSVLELQLNLNGAPALIVSASNQSRSLE